MPISLEHTYYEGQTDALQGSGPIPPMGMGRDEYLAGYADVLDRFAVAEVQHGGDPADAFVAYVQEEPDFSSVASVLQRVRSLEEWRDLFTARASNREASDGEITAYADLAELASEEIDVARGALAAHEDKRAASFAGGIPGGVSVSVSDGIGQDDGSFMFEEASEALGRYARIDWEGFSTEHFAQWVSDQHPHLLAHREVRAEAAAEYAQEVTAAIEDLRLRGELVSEFVAAAEDYEPEDLEEPEVPEELDLEKEASQYQMHVEVLPADASDSGEWEWYVFSAGEGWPATPEEWGNASDEADAFSRGQEYIEDLGEQHDRASDQLIKTSRTARRHIAADCTADSEGNGCWDCDAGPGGTPCAECRKLQLDAGDDDMAEDLRAEWAEMRAQASRIANYDDDLWESQYAVGYQDAKAGTIDGQMMGLGTMAGGGYQAGVEDAQAGLSQDPERHVAAPPIGSGKRQQASRTAAYGEPAPFDPDAAEQVSIYKSHSSPFPWLLVTAKGALVRHTDLGKIGTIEDAIATANQMLGRELKWEITRNGGDQQEDSARYK